MFQCDLTADKLTSSIPPSSVDLVSLIFVLSSVTPEKMATVVENIAEVCEVLDNVKPCIYHTQNIQVLKPGGLVLFRDYGLYDHAMLRFSKGHKISEHFYVRQDGTRAYYFMCGEHLNNVYMYFLSEKRTDRWFLLWEFNRQNRKFSLHKVTE